MEYLKNVSTINIKDENCTGCFMCIQVCPHNVIIKQNKKAFVNKRDACMECGACKMNCPENAIEVQTGVGCAAAIIIGYIKGTEPSCDCTDSGCC
jgi:MinD superfamily P-loop ATPase